MKVSLFLNFLTNILSHNNRIFIILISNIYPFFFFFGRLRQPRKTRRSIGRLLKLATPAINDYMYNIQITDK